MKLLKILKLSLQLIIIGIIFYFMGRVLYLNWQDISLEDVNINIYALIGSFFILSIYFLFLVRGWLLILQYMNINLEFICGMKIFFYSQLGKYLPGKIWMIMGKIYLSDKYGISKKKVLLSSFIEMFASILSGLSLFLISLHFEENFKVSSKLLFITLFFIPILLILLNPKVISYFVNIGLKLFKREVLKIDFTFNQIISIFFYYLFAWFIIGIGFYMLIGSFVDISYTKIPILAGSLSLAGTIGIISFFVPGGIGVREGILALLLSNFLSAPIAVFSALACRAWLTAGEVVLLAVAYKLRLPIKYINGTTNQ